MKKKILFLPSWYPSDDAPYNGIFVQEQALALSNEYDVAVLFPRVFGLSRWKEMKTFNPKFKIGYREGIRVYQISKVIASGHSLKLANQSYVKIANIAFKRILNEWGQPDIIHFHVILPAGIAAIDLGRRYGIPTVLTEHSSPFSMHTTKKQGKNSVNKIFASVNRVIAVSPKLRNEILSFRANTKIEIVGELIKTDFFEINTETFDPSSPPITRFLSVALFSQQKGLDNLLQAAHILCQRGIKSFEIIIGGDGPIKAELERKKEQFDLNEKCIFMGLLSRDEVRSWMQKSDVFVLPSRHESFGIVLGEAMACGKPVISTLCGGPEFIVTQETGVLVEIDHPMQLADAMELFIKGNVIIDPYAIRQNVRERFGEEVFLKNITEIYQSIWKEN